MCLAIPAQLVSITNNNNPLLQKGRVDFSGISKEISLAYVPEAKIGDFLIVHAGFALSVLQEDEAKASLQAFQEFTTFQNAE